MGGEKLNLMGKFIDITGERYGKLVAVNPTDKRTKSGGVIWVFKCDCGNTKISPANSVKSGLIKSCGCLCHTHGMTGTRLFNIWVDMRQRCYNKNYPQFYLWGGKGVKVCDEWLQDFMTFYNWAIENGYANNLSIERKDSNGNYEPSNCKWATPKEQARNISTNRMVTIDGETKGLSEWLDTSPITISTFYKRKNKGMTDKEALFTPSMSNNKFKKKKVI